MAKINMDDKVLTSGQSSIAGYLQYNLTMLLISEDSFTKIQPHRVHASGIRSGDFQDRGEKTIGRAYLSATRHV